MHTIEDSLSPDIDFGVASSEVVKQTAYTSKADIWSLGCVTVEMLTGDHPYVKLNQMQALFKVGSYELSTDMLSTDLIY